MEKGREEIIRHLEMIQNIIDRMGRNSFMLKGWAVVLMAASIWLLARSGTTDGYGNSGCIRVGISFAVIWLWVLDGYFLRQERLFRKVYDKVRKGESTDFSMNPSEFVEQTPNWLSTCIGWNPAPNTLVIFYAPLILMGVILP